MEVNDLEMRGFRRRKGAASLLRRLERRREKKRKSRRWKRRMRDREAERRKLGDLRRGFLVNLVLQSSVSFDKFSFLSVCDLPLRLRFTKDSVLQPFPQAQPCLGREENSQSCPYCGSVEVIFSVNKTCKVTRRWSIGSDQMWRPSKQVSMEIFVFFFTQCISESIAGDWMRFGFWPIGGGGG